MLVFPPDITLVIQFLGFFALLWVLNRLLFLPFGQLLDERAAHTIGATAAAERLRADAEEIRCKLAAELAEARTKAGEEAEVVRRRTRADEAAIFERAKGEASTRLAELRQGIEQERAAAASALRSEAAGLARGMVDAVLGSPPQV
jgi:F-type H+-transporting ATPase subunit b